MSDQNNITKESSDKTSSYVCDSSLDIMEAKHMFFEKVEAYLAGKRHQEVPIPWHLFGVSE